MINIIFGRENCDESKFILDSRAYFRDHKEPEWFDDPLVQEFLLAVDGSTVLFQEALKDYRGKGISTDKISSGCKTLCDIYFSNDGSIFNGSMMGNNCIPFLLRIAQKKDFTMVLEHYMDFPEESFDLGCLFCNGRKLTQRGYDDAFSNWNATNDPKMEGYYDTE